jgi:uncharacterized protein DUF222/HNH endonuclease
MFVSVTDTRLDVEIEDDLSRSFFAESRLVRRRLADIVELDGREAWRIDSARSMVDWLCYRFDLSERTAREYVRVGHALEFLPALADAFEKGWISWDKLRAVTTFATPEEDAALARDLPMLTTAQVLIVARHRRRLSKVHALRRRKERSLRTRWDEDEGMLHIWGEIPDADGAAVRKALDAVASEAPRQPSGGYVDSHDRRCADALVTLCTLGSGGRSNPDRAHVTVYADIGTLSADAGTATVEGSIAITPETVRRLTCDARIRLAATSNGATIGLGRTRRTVPPWLYAELMRRDGGCRWEGCTSTRWLHAHHVKHWARGGATDADNLVMLCGFHHREVHEGGADIQLAQDGRVMCIRRDGRALARAP